MKKRRVSRIASLLCAAVFAVSLGAMSACGDSSANTENESAAETQWHYGTTAPADNLGNVGDHYLDTESLRAYVRAANGQWEPTALYSGAGVPEPTDGVTGDLYLDTASGVLYQKGDTYWEIVMKVEKGANGRDGVMWFSGTAEDPNKLEEGNTTLKDARSGDFYLATGTFTVWQLGADDTWRNLGSIKGDDGKTPADGKDGTRWFYGKGAPEETAQDAKVGDFYMRYYDAVENYEGYQIYVREEAGWSVLVDNSPCKVVGHQCGEDDVCDICGLKIAFAGSSYHDESGDEYVIQGVPANTTDLVIPGKVNGKPVKFGDSSTFVSCRDTLKSLTFESGITEIPDNMFKYCSKLESVTFSEGLTSIGSFVFQSTALTSVTLPDSLTHLGDRAFMNCTQLTTVNFGKNITEIDDYTFQGDTALRTVNFGDSHPTKFGQCAFTGCTSLEEIDVPGSVKIIGVWAFWKCSSLQNVVFHEGVEEIQRNAFQGCSSLESIVLPDSVTNIDSGALGGCDKLLHIQIGVTSSKLSNVHLGAFTMWANGLQIDFRGTRQQWNDAGGKSIPALIKVHCLDD